MLKVIGSGFGRTGTTSLKAALEQLGFSPCYHMSELVPDSKRVRQWYDIARGQSADWPAIMEGFQATTDFPACIFYRELMEAFPEAKVVHTVRDPDRWYESAIDTIFKFSDTVPLWLQRLIKPVGRLMGMIDTLIKRGVFEGDYGNRQRVIEIFRQHTENVINTVPPERLLVFDVKQGWEPLCRFLDVPVPDTPFPHVNDTEEFKAMNRRMYRLFHWGPIAVGVTLLAVIGSLAAWLR